MPAISLRSIHCSESGLWAGAGVFAESFMFIATDDTHFHANYPREPVSICGLKGALELLQLSPRLLCLLTEEHDVVLAFVEIKT